VELYPNLEIEIQHAVQSLYSWSLQPIHHRTYGCASDTLQTP